MTKIKIKPLKTRDKKYHCQNRQQSPGNVPACDFPVRRFRPVCIANLKRQIPTEQLICKEDGNCCNDTDQYTEKPCAPLPFMGQLRTGHHFNYSRNGRLHWIRFRPVFIYYSSMRRRYRKKHILYTSVLVVQPAVVSIQHTTAKEDLISKTNLNASQRLPPLALLRHSSWILFVGIGAIDFVSVSKFHRLTFRHNKTGLLPLNSAGIYRASVFLLWDENGIFVFKSHPGNGYGINHGKHQNHGDHKKKNSLLVPIQTFDPFQNCTPILYISFHSLRPIRIKASLIQ